MEIVLTSEHPQSQKKQLHGKDVDIECARKLTAYLGNSNGFGGAPFPAETTIRAREITKLNLQLASQVNSIWRNGK
jgi:hypothetical protein